MARDRMQECRYELKYLIAEQTAQKVRDFVRCHLSMDEYGVGKPNFAYPVHSLYVDSDRLEIYWRTINGDKNRYKLRLRYYSDNPGSPVFFEIKRRMNEIIIKQRGGVRKEVVSLLLRGQFPEPGDLLSSEPKALVAVQRFCQLMTEMNATPRVHIYYKREAYVSDDDTVRVTMDRDVFAEPHFAWHLKTKMVKPVESYKKTVILELKFTNRFPAWFGDLVRVINAVQCGAAKYVSSVNELGHVRLHAHAEVLEEESLLSSVQPGADLPVRARLDKGFYPDPSRL